MAQLCCGWTILQLIPLYLFLPRLDIANERQLYLAAWPLLLALSIELSLWLNTMTLRLVAAALLLSYTSLTVMRNQVYSSEIRLWQDTALKSPDKARVHNNLGHAYCLHNITTKHASEFTTALMLDPQLYQARYNLLRAERNGKGRRNAPALNLATSAIMRNSSPRNPSSPDCSGRSRQTWGARCGSRCSRHVPTRPRTAAACLAGGQRRPAAPMLTMSSEPSAFFTSQVQPEPKLPTAEVWKAFLNSSKRPHFLLIASASAPPVRRRPAASCSSRRRCGSRPGPQLL